MKQYIKGKEIKYADEIVIIIEKEVPVIKDEKNPESTVTETTIQTTTIFCPTEEQILADGWIEYKKSDKQIIEEKRIEILNNIDIYDKSSNVNEFYINGTPAWLDRETRISVERSTRICKNKGMATTNLWLGEVSLEFPCDLLIQLLGDLEMYALECYNITAKHKAEVNKIPYLEDLETYDITKDYPTKLNFDLTKTAIQK